MSAAQSLPQSTVIVTTPDELRAIVREAAREAVVAYLAAAPAPSVAPRLHSARDAAPELGTSATGMQRLTSAGMPVVMVGTRRRYDLAACREWLAQHGGRPLPMVAAAAPKKGHVEDDPIDVSGVVSRSGLRRVGGRR